MPFQGAGSIIETVEQGGSVAYLVLKLVHVIAVVLFLGNIITGLFWKSHAQRSKNPAVIAHTFQGIIRADRWFTVPGVIVIVTAGIFTAVLENIPILRTGWIFWSIALFLVSGVVFWMRVAPLQLRIAALAGSGRSEEQFDWPRYHSLARAWEIWGLAALLTPLAAVVLMVLKPELSGV